MEARVALFLVGQMGEQKRESQEGPVDSPGLFSAAAASKEVTIQQLPPPTVQAHCQLTPGTRGLHFKGSAPPLPTNRSVKRRRSEGSQ